MYAHLGGGIVVIFASFCLQFSPRRSGEALYAAHGLGHSARQRDEEGIGERGGPGLAAPADPAAAHAHKHLLAEPGLRSPHAVDLEQDRVCSRLSHTQETLGGPLDGVFLSCHHERIEPVIEVSMASAEAVSGFWGTGGPRSMTNSGDQGVFSLGWPGHRRLDVAPRGPILGRTKAREVPPSFRRFRPS